MTISDSIYIKLKFSFLEQFFKQKLEAVKQWMISNKLFCCKGIENEVLLKSMDFLDFYFPKVYLEF